MSWDHPSPPPGSPLASLACLPFLPPFPRLLEQQTEQLRCETSPNPTPATLPVVVRFGATERRLQHSQFEYTLDPNVTSAGPTKSFLRCWAEGMAVWRVAGRSLQAQYMRALEGFLAHGERGHVALAWGGAIFAGTGLCFKARFS